jgi:sulfate permease, SulP family
VPHAVLTGFVNAVAVSIVLGQLGGFTGYDSDQGSRLTRALGTVLNLGSLHWPTVLIGTVAIGLIVALERTRLGSLGLLVAVAASSAAVVGLGAFDTVLQLGDLTDIPGNLPRPVLPERGSAPALLLLGCCIDSAPRTSSPRDRHSGRRCTRRSNGLRHSVSQPDDRP